jgi:hypothetical protein
MPKGPKGEKRPADVTGVAVTVCKYPSMVALREFIRPGLRTCL